MTRGVVVLPTILILGSVIIGIVLAGVFIAQLINRSNFGLRLEAEVTNIANAAAQDIYLRLNKSLLSVTQPCPNFLSSPDYSLPPSGRVSADVYLCQTSCGASICQYEAKIDARANVFVNKRFRVVFDADPVTGQVRVGALNLSRF